MIFNRRDIFKGLAAAAVTSAIPVSEIPTNWKSQARYDNGNKLGSKDFQTLLNLFNPAGKIIYQAPIIGRHAEDRRIRWFADPSQMLIPQGTVIEPFCKITLEPPQVIINFYKTIGGTPPEMLIWDGAPIDARLGNVTIDFDKTNGIVSIG